MPEILITAFANPTQNDVAALTSETLAATGTMDIFAMQEHLQRQMRALIGHRIGWLSQKAGGVPMEGTASRCGKRRLTVVLSDGNIWRVPLNLIRTVDGQPWTYRRPGT